MESKVDLYRYRADYKAGLVAEYKDTRVRAVTLTMRDEVLEQFYSEAGVNRHVRRWMHLQGLTGFVVVERSKAGRLHAHGLLNESPGLNRAIDWWRKEYGFVVAVVPTDLIGWITYLMKAFGPDSEYTWSKEAQSWLGDKLPGGVTGPTERTGAVIGTRTTATQGGMAHVGGTVSIGGVGDGK